MLRPAALVALALVVFAGTVLAAPLPTQPGFDGAPHVSPDGKWLLFQRYFGGGSRYTAPDTTLQIAAADGTADRELVGRRLWVSLDARWTPDNLVEVVLSESDGSVSTTLRRPDDGSVVRELSIAPRAWSPDGNWIAYVDDRALYVARPDGSQARPVASAPELGLIGVGEFSPDSTRLTYVVGPSRSPNRSEVVRIDGTDRHVLREAPVVAPGEWSPDGSAVVLVAQNDTGHYRPPRTWVMNAGRHEPAHDRARLLGRPRLVAQRRLDRLRARDVDQDARSPRAHDRAAERNRSTQGRRHRRRRGSVAGRQSAPARGGIRCVPPFGDPRDRRLRANRQASDEPLPYRRNAPGGRDSRHTASRPDRRTRRCRHDRRRRRRRPDVRRGGERHDRLEGPLPGHGQLWPGHRLRGRGPSRPGRPRLRASPQVYVTAAPR